ncbi:MAG: Dabb family protein [Terriglobia bacterium]
MKRAVWTMGTVVVLAGIFLAGMAVGKNQYGTPPTVLHVVAGKWTDEATDEQKQQAMEALKDMAAEIDGIKNIWVSPERIQPREFNYAFAIEFESREAADAYAEHPAHDVWYKIYLPLRDQSRSLQISNR